MDDSKKKILQATLGQIRRQFGQGSIMRLGDDDVDRTIEVNTNRFFGGWILFSE